MERETGDGIEKLRTTENAAGHQPEHNGFTTEAAEENGTREFGVSSPV